MQRGISKHVSFCFLILVAYGEGHTIKPFGYEMCSNECKKVGRCKSFVVMTSDSSCSLRDENCPRELAKKNQFCRNVDKSLIKEADKCSETEKRIQSRQKLLRCVRIYVNKLSQRKWKSIIFTYEASRSFYVLSANASDREKVNVDFKIYRIRSFTANKVLFAVQKPNSLIVFDIESKMVKTIVENIKIDYTAQGEESGVVYFIGEKDKKLRLWKVSAVDMEPKKIAIGNLRARSLEVDQETGILYISTEPSCSLVKVDPNLTIISKMPVKCIRYCTSLTMDRGNGILYMIWIRFFRISTLLRFVLAGKRVEKVLRIHHCVQGFVFLDGFFYVSQKEKHVHKLFRATLKNNELQYKDMIYKHSNRIFIS